jgi:hypothetical protein
MLEMADNFCRLCHVCQMLAGRANTAAGTGFREPAGGGAHLYIDTGYVGGDAGEERHFMIFVD